MNPIGINLWNWTGNFNASGIKYIEKAASIGYTAIEIGLENTEFVSQVQQSIATPVCSLNTSNGVLPP